MSPTIQTTHAGSLPRPDALVTANEARRDGAEVPGYDTQLADAVREVVDAQRGLGIDLVNDGEYGHSMGERYDYGAWWSYVFGRLGGLELVDVALLDAPQAPARPGEVTLASFNERRDWQAFADAYADPASGAALPNRPPVTPMCRGPITYTGAEQVQRDISNLKAALEATGIAEGYMNSVAPGSCARFANEFYASDEELIYACADAMREEYRAIVDAGLVLQLDDPSIAENWDQINPAPSIEDYRRFTQVRIDALNHAIRDLPPERMRFHLCWGSWHGPHTTDIEMSDIVDLMLSVNVGAYSFEAANARHEHEWALWEQVALADDRRILPGVVGHSTNVVEHPDLVAERILRFARAVGPDRVVASTDCGLGGRVHPEIAWAKLGVLAEGARRASERL